MQRIDTLRMALQAIRTNRLRSALTLVGIVLGVASIIAVMTGITVVQGTMEKEMSILGAQTFQVPKFTLSTPSVRHLSFFLCVVKKTSQHLLPRLPGRAFS